MKANNEMIAVIQSAYGTPEVLRHAVRPIPEHSPTQILVEVKAFPVSQADGMMRKGTPRFARLFLGLTKPKAQTPGSGFAGVVKAVGSEVKNFQVGDRVFGGTTTDFGSNAQYLKINQSDWIFPMPSKMTFEEGASVTDGVLTSFNFLHRVSKVKPGMEVAIVGASGALGSAAIQLAKAEGARVTAICSAKNHDFVLSLGADQVVDYRQDDFTQNQNQYDIIYDTPGKLSFKKCKPALKDSGVYSSPVLSFGILAATLTGFLRTKAAKFDATGLLKADLAQGMIEEILSLYDNKKLKIEVSKVFPFKELQLAHQHIDSGKKVANVVCTPQVY